MKNIATIFILVLVAGCNNISNKGVPKTPKTTPPMDSVASAKMFEEISTPGSMQKNLAAYAGKWNEVHTFWQNENSAGNKDSLSIENEMILGGRYLQTRETGIMQGKPFEGIGMLGYDNLKKMFVSTWQDNMMTGILYFEGYYDSAAKAITLRGQYTNLSKGKVEIRQTFRIISDNHYENDWYGTQPGAKEMLFTKKEMTRK